MGWGKTFAEGKALTEFYIVYRLLNNYKKYFSLLFLEICGKY
ncbi:hypothetical protein M23134_02258 [Microscilla marina ATCC 23134]|uniref:Uncharacterized protein n=1 Tax=Microscilla marina ATCC 23134 TaxID=313606 RepID=A1ZK41_MICM2|nr:hypothetical protein M23134_02258 [Microscilla marina ATCC 23134]